MNAQDVLDIFQVLVEQFNGRWQELYNPDEIKILKKEFGEAREGLESMLLHPQEDIEFYRRDNLRLDESRLAELNSLSDEGKAIVRFIAYHQHTVKGIPAVVSKRDRLGTYYCTAKYEDIKRYVFEYLKRSNPNQLRKIVDCTIDDALETSGDGIFARAQDKWREHFTNLGSKGISDITIDDIEPPHYKRMRNYDTPLKSHAYALLKNLIDRGILQISPGYQKTVVSVSPSYLLQN